MTGTAMNVRGVTLTVFPPRDAEEAQSRGLFESDSGVTYAHYNAVSPADGEQESTYGLTHSYNALADKLTELLMEARIEYKAALDKARGAKKDQVPLPSVTIMADVNMTLIPWQKGNQSGVNTEWKIYGFAYGEHYYTTQGGQLVVRANTRKPTTEDFGAPARQPKVSFFDF